MSACPSSLAGGGRLVRLHISLDISMARQPHHRDVSWARSIQIICVAYNRYFLGSGRDVRHVDVEEGGGGNGEIQRYQEGLVGRFDTPWRPGGRYLTLRQGQVELGQEGDAIRAKLLEERHGKFIGRSGRN